MKLVDFWNGLKKSAGFEKNQKMDSATLSRQIVFYDPDAESFVKAFDVVGCRKKNGGFLLLLSTRPRRGTGDSITAGRLLAEIQKLQNRAQHDPAKLKKVCDLPVVLGDGREVAEVLYNDVGRFFSVSVAGSGSIDESAELEEGFGSLVSIATLAAMLSMTGVMAQSDIEKHMKAEMKQQAGKPLSASGVQNAIKASLKTSKKYGGYDQAQAASILAWTLYGEARGKTERRSGGINRVADVILNRAGGDLDKVPAVCLRPAQFSTWNGTDRKETTPAAWKATAIPAEVKDSGLELAAWNDCKDLAGRVMSGEYKAEDKKINAYWACKGPYKIEAPYWDAKMTDTKIVGSHKFGYLKSEDPNAKKTAKKPVEYVVKSGDTLGKIAKANGTTVSDLMAKNPKIKSADKIQIGQKIKLA